MAHKKTLLYEKALSEVNNIFSAFNKYLFNSLLETPIVTIQTNGRHRTVMGWCTTRRVWQEKNSDNSYYEITVCAEHLYRRPLDIAETLLHEMVHLFCLQNNIKATTRSDMYHNKKFKEAAESHGLNVEFEISYGWYITKLSADTANFIMSKINSKNLTLTRNRPFTIGDNGEIKYVAEHKQRVRKYVCPKCKSIVRATKEVNIICGDCNEPFIQELK